MHKSIRAGILAALRDHFNLPANARQSDIAEAIGISQGHLSKYLNGSEYPYKFPTEVMSDPRVAPLMINHIFHGLLLRNVLDCQPTTMIVESNQWSELSRQLCLTGLAQALVQGVDDHVILVDAPIIVYERDDGRSMNFLHYCRKIEKGACIIELEAGLRPPYTRILLTWMYGLRRRWRQVVFDARNEQGSFPAFVEYSPEEWLLDRVEQVTVL